MILTIYYFLLFTILGIILMVGLFFYLLFRKVIMNHYSKKTTAYYNFVFPHIIRYIAGEQFWDGFGAVRSNREKKIIVEIIMQIIDKIKSKEKIVRIHQLVELLKVDVELSMQLGHRTWWEVAEAINIIGKLKLRKFIPVIKSKLYTASTLDIFMVSARALCRMGETETIIRFLIERDGYIHNKVLLQLGNIINRSTVYEKQENSLIIEHLNNVSIELQEIFIDILGKRKVTDAISVLQELVKNEKSEIRLKALRSLGKIGILINDKYILDFLNSENWIEKVISIYVIEKCRILHAGQVLLHKCLADQNWWVRVRAAEALYSFGFMGIESLRWASTHHNDQYARDMASKILQERELNGV